MSVPARRCQRLPEPPYIAVIFTAVRAAREGDGYAEVAARMETLAAAQPGYLGLEAARDPDGFGQTVSYWRTREDATAWKQIVEHRGAQARGLGGWYSDYTVRIAQVVDAYDMDSPRVAADPGDRGDPAGAS